MKELKLGTYVNCKNLTNQQAQKLLDKWKELVGDSCKDVDEDTSDFDCINYFLVYGINYEGANVIWFWDCPFNAGIEMFYEDFFPEESEQELVERPKTIDLERDSRTFDVKIAEFDVGFVNLGEGYTIKEIESILTKDLKTHKIGNDYDVFDKNGEPKFLIYQDGGCEVYQSYKVESEETYQQRVQREKHLNDWYNQELQKLTKENLEL